MVKLSFKQIGGRGERMGVRPTTAIERHAAHTAAWAAAVISFSAELSQARSFSFLEPKNSCRRAACFNSNHGFGGKLLSKLQQSKKWKQYDTFTLFVVFIGLSLSAPDLD